MTPVAAARPEERTERAAFRDPAFMMNRVAPLHRWVPWIAGFSSQFIDDTFREFLQTRKKTQLVLDPFAGVGTTLVQAVLNGHDAVGFEINPYAALAIRAKLEAVSLDVAKLDALIAEIRFNLTALPKGSYLEHRPNGFRSKIPFFSGRVEPQILKIKDLISRLPDKQLADVARMALGAVLVKVSNYTYEPSLGSRPGAGKPLIEDADVAKVFVDKLQQIREDVLWLQEQVGSKAKWEVHCANFLDNESRLERGSVDLMVTSPPYLNNYHYVRNTRPQLFWLSLVESTDELKALEHSNFGKYWQTVRASDPLPIGFDHPELGKIVNRLRVIRNDRGIYGGAGWANYVTSYFNDTDKFLRNLAHSLRKGGAGVVVIGNSIIQGINIEVDRILGEMGAAHGVPMDRIIPLRTKRVGASITSSSVRRGEKSSATLYETAVVLKKS